MFNLASLGLTNIHSIVDVGAGVGTFLRPALAYYNPDKHLAIEMLADRVIELHRNGIRYVIHCAVGQERGWATVRRTVSADSSSLLVIDPRAQEWFTPAPGGMTQYDDGCVEVRTLDEIFDMDHVVYPPVIDLMKMDIQGYEARALRGGPRTLRLTRALIIELLFCHHYEHQSEPDEIHEILSDYGFRAEKLVEDHWNGPIHLQEDVLYVNSNF